MSSRRSREPPCDNRIRVSERHIGGAAVRYEIVSDLRLRDSRTMSDAILPLGRRVLVSGFARPDPFARTEEIG
jgi:hypothetical protein